MLIPLEHSLNINGSAHDQHKLVDTSLFYKAVMADRCLRFLFVSSSYARVFVGHSDKQNPTWSQQANSERMEFSREDVGQLRVAEKKMASRDFAEHSVEDI